MIRFLKAKRYLKLFRLDLHQKHKQKINKPLMGDNDLVTKQLHKFIGPASIFLAALLVFGVRDYIVNNPLTTNPVNGQKNSCELLNKQCVIDLGSHQIKVHFEGDLVVEESLEMFFASEFPIELESVWVEGVNMFMGKVPVLVESKDSKNWTGWFMLGACSEPHMQWVMFINVKGQQEPALVYFSTKIT